MARQWILNSQRGFEESLEYQTDLPIPSVKDLGSHQVIVKLEGASLNYRELQISRPNSINGPIKPSAVPGCDGAGTVLAVGPSVTEFKPGDHVVAFTAPDAAEKRGDDAVFAMADVYLALGQGTDGTLRTHGVFSEKALVHAPEHLDSLRASTLTCTWLTAWNAFFGLKGQEAKKGSWVLVLGTGGVSTAALQLGVAMGANVVATTSSAAKATKLKELGALHVINYRETENWGEEARKLTPGGQGFDIIIDIGGDQTLGQSLAAVRVDGQVIVTGSVGAQTDKVPMFLALVHTCVIRGILAGSRTQMKEMIKFVGERKLVPVVDSVVFELRDAKDAYRRLEQMKHFSKVVIRID